MRFKPRRKAKPGRKTRSQRNRDRNRELLSFENIEPRRLLAVLFADSSEQGEWNGQWVEDSQNDWFRSTHRANDGSYSAEVDGRANDAALTMANPIDLTSYSTDSLQNQNTLGTLLLRAGETEEAIKVLTDLAEQLDNPSKPAIISPAYTWYALALAYHDAGQADEARKWRDKADAWTAQELNNPTSKPAWNRKLSLELLRKEVNSKIDSEHLPDPNSTQPPDNNRAAIDHKEKR